MKLILIIVLSCNFAALCFAGVIIEKDLRQKVTSISKLIGSDKLDDAVVELADAYKNFERRPSYIETLDQLTSKLEKFTKKLEVESQSLDKHINQILEEWIKDKGREELVMHDGIYALLKKELKINNPHKDSIPYLTYNSLEQSELCGLFVDPNQLQGEAATYARIAFLLKEMSLRHVHPGPLNDQGQMLYKLEVYCNELKQYNRNVSAIFDRSSSDI